MRTGFRHKRQCSVVFPYLVGRCSGSRPYILSDFATPGNSFRLLQVQPGHFSWGVLVFSVSPRQVSAEAVVLNPAQKLAQTALNLDLVAVETQFCLFVRADPASLLFSFPPSCFPSHHHIPLPCLSSLAFFYPSLGQGPMQ